MNRIVIAIDGPAGAGKSTVAKRVARELGLRFLDTGAMYRCLALFAQRNGLTADDGVEVAKMAKDCNIEFGDGDPQSVFLDGEDVTALIRTPEMGEFASALSVHSDVRKLLATQQRAIVERGGVTLEGRDTTTVTAPDAQVRVFLTASVQERARRRHAEFEDKGIERSLQEIQDQIEARDHRDSNRADSPLTVAPGVLVIDSNELTIDEVVDEVKRVAELASIE
ncbi:MAG: (d)CMP kinase, partial [Fimbriimonadaceae bacterium]